MNRDGSKLEDGLTTGREELVERIELNGKRASNGKGAHHAADESAEDKLTDLYIGLRSPEREKVFATTSAAAEIAGVRDRTIRQWIDEGKIVSIQPFNYHMVYLPSLIAHLKAGS